MQIESTKSFIKSLNSSSINLLEMFDFFITEAIEVFFIYYFVFVYLFIFIVVFILLFLLIFKYLKRTILKMIIASKLGLIFRSISVMPLDKRHKTARHKFHMVS